MVLYDHLCSVFPRGTRKNRTSTEIRYRSAEGKNADRVTPVNDGWKPELQTLRPERAACLYG